MRTHVLQRSPRAARGKGALVAAGTALVALSAAASAASAAPLVYYGGGVISSVEVVQVAWTSNVSAAHQAELTQFYETILGSTYLDWLSEYDTIGKVGFGDGLPGSEQHIGRGSFTGAFVIAPSNAATALSGKDIEQELAAQIGTGALPKPELDADGRVRSLYMIDFPPGYDITHGGEVGCANFVAYHGTIVVDGLAVPYGVHPDCGLTFGRVTTAHTHELVEAITDPDTGLALGLGRPMAWRTTADDGGAKEISDLCEGSGVGLVGGYKVAKSWSNFAGGCVVEVPVCDGELESPACRPCSAHDSGFACSGETPLCAEDGAKKGQCVACTAADASACVGAIPLCDGEANTCVGCLADADCGAEEVCEEHACAARPVEATTGAGSETEEGEGCAVGGGAGGKSAAGGWLFAALAVAWGRLRSRSSRSSRRGPR